jgi:hypothetical protein
MQMMTLLEDLAEEITTGQYMNSLGATEVRAS